MIVLALAVALPALLWEEPPDTAPLLREAGITAIRVPSSQYAAWKGADHVSVQPMDVLAATKVQSPSVQYRANLASASRSPWLVSNGWRFLRNPRGRFFYDARGPQAALAAAEAFCFGADAAVRSDRPGLKALAEMLDFLRGLGESEDAAIADIGFVDDGSPAAGEVMNLMVRENLLFKLIPDPGRKPSSDVKLTVKLGTKDFPLEESKNPGMTAHEVRARLTDDKRSVRIYGSAVVVVRLTTRPSGLRVHLLNYAGAERKVDGVRVRVLGNYPNHHVSVAGNPQADVLDYATDGEGTEFTLPELKTYAIIDLSK